MDKTTLQNLAELGEKAGNLQYKKILDLLYQYDHNTEKNIDNVNLEEIDKKALFMALDITEADRNFEQREKEETKKKRYKSNDKIAEILQYLEKAKKKIESHDEPFTMKDALDTINYLLYYYWK